MKTFKNNRGFTLGNLLILISLVGALIAGFILFDIEKVEGNQLGVKESWSEGVHGQPLTPKTYFLFPGFTQDIYKYDI